jgi:hypothetical protein
MYTILYISYALIDKCIGFVIFGTVYYPCVITCVYDPCIIISHAVMQHGATF